MRPLNRRVLMPGLPAVLIAPFTASGLVGPTLPSLTYTIESALAVAARAPMPAPAASSAVKKRGRESIAAECQDPDISSSAAGRVQRRPYGRSEGRPLGGRDGQAAHDVAARVAHRRLGERMQRGAPDRP